MKPEPSYNSSDKSKFQIFAEQKMSLLQSGAKTAKQIAQNPRIADEKTVNERRNICSECEYLDKQRNRCKKCGCMLKAKTAFKGTKCPIGKW
jgi:hypothetical protein